DVIVRETWEFGGWLAAATLRLPHASVEVTLHAFTMAYAEPVAASLSGILARAGQPAENVLERLFAQLHLSFVPPSFEDPAAPLPAMAHSLRPLLLEPLPGEPEPGWLANLPDRPTVYVTGGTLRTRTSFFEPIIEGARDLDINLVATLGRMVDPDVLGPQPEHVYLTGYVSQALLLPRCAAVVNHGGFNSVLGALTCGVPLVVLPDGADRSVNARRATELGVAIVLDENQRTPAAIQAAVRSVLEDPGYRRRAQAIQAEIAALPGPDHGVHLLEHLVAGREAPEFVRNSPEAVI
ncbi:MAG TPA: nucleotide disphospho-sugar-binding domain-containing protein, partial [Thermomicrobiales bacterium]|nr:nucleotide disphospho-sugar-binding domain-containing protein [Thermomicrobiales bacterium]